MRTTFIIIVLSVITHPYLATAYTTIDAYTASTLWSSGIFRVLVDVRKIDEWEAGHLPNATSIPSLHENRDASRLAGCEDCAIAVYCTSGYRSKRAADVLEGEGFNNVYDVLGINQWRKAGVNLVSGDEDRDPFCCDASCPAMMVITNGVGGNMSISMVAIGLVALGAVVLILTA